MATALFAALIAGATVVLFQVSAAWATQAEDPVLDRHAENLERFLRRTLTEAQGAVTEPTAEQISEEHALLSVRMPENLPWHEILGVAGGDVTGRLAFRDGALILHWQTATERRLALAEPHRMVLSPWVVSARIFLHDAVNNQWTEYAPSEPVAGQPGFNASRGLRVLRVELDRGGHRRVLQILIRRSGS